MSALGRLIVPAIRLDEPAERRLTAASVARLGAGGVLLFGGERDEVRRATEDLRAAAARPLLIGADLERGAGHQVRGLHQLPPALALAALAAEPSPGGAADPVREAASLTAAEARAVGVNWILAPVLDLDVEPANPIVQTRSFGPDPDVVARHGVACLEAFRSGGVLSCGKHFPGHGRTTVDSHAALPVVAASRATLEADLAPFRAAIAAGVETIMTAHVAYPALDPSGQPATFAAPIVRDLLRGELGFGGLVVTDALIMAGAQSAGGVTEAAVRAIRAGCDLLLYPPDPVTLAADLERAVRRGDLPGPRVEQALERVERAAAQVADLGGAAAAVPASGAADALALRAVRAVRGDLPRVVGPVEIAMVDDDAGGPYPLPPRTAFAEELRRCGVEVRDGAAERVVLLFADVKSWKGRAGLSAAGAARLSSLLLRPATVVLFGHARRLAEVPGTGPVVCAWSGDEAMQRAAARRLARGAP